MARTKKTLAMNKAMTAVAARTPTPTRAMKATLKITMTLSKRDWHG